ncbi:AbiV family abortive infection protein [Mucilaginibacter conchicola]|uniref:AbiV family abortive infection protein n=1 Tax=Mucilaginibacter conchicola TaxID=2303333 RepID=A0A372NMU6_9SPHI|nr:AbiV family abortive infection protein [Mucilaginibacter conchicola]RFZ89917.1 AbiV family abortive infection protein [Mucilaginibacter conchicola]
MTLSQTEILKLFNASVENSFEMFQSALHTVSKYEGKKYVSLGIAELALEELGKSYTLLSHYSKARKNVDWNQFWKDWRNHDLKASRGFFYEFFCTLRVEIRNPSDKILDNVIPRGKFSIEKELAFYVDIDRSTKKIHRPFKDISDEESFNRVLSLVGLLNPALRIKDWLNSTEPNSFKDALSDYANVTLTENVYQQDVQMIISRLKGSDEDYNRALDEVWGMFKSDNTFKER